MLTKIQKVYDDIAINAFNNYSISRDKKNNINDIFIHKNEAQKEFQKEYIHYSGFDICLGDGKDIYCAILVRGIINDSKVIYGPGRVKYKRKEKKKLSREIKIKFNSQGTKKIFFLDDADNTMDLENIIFKLPRVNLANTTCSKFLEAQDSIDKLKTYLNLKARYLRIKDEKFYKLKIENFNAKSSPEEPREIFNELTKYKKKIINV